MPIDCSEPDSSKLYANVHQANDAITKLQDALQLPFRPARLMPVKELLDGINGILLHNSVLREAVRKRDDYIDAMTKRLEK